MSCWALFNDFWNLPWMIETYDSASEPIWEGHPGSGQLAGSVVLLKTRLSILPSLLVHVPLRGRRPPMGDGKSKWPKHSPLSKFNSDPSPSPIYLCLLFARICSDNILRRTRYTTCCADLLTSALGEPQGVIPWIHLSRLSIRKIARF